MACWGRPRHLHTRTHTTRRSHSIARIAVSSLAGVIEPFPEKLMRLLNECEAAGRTDVVSWIANGRAFAIHKPDKFFKEIVPLYFRQSRLSSFKRQLNLYGFELINSGPARGGYYHEVSMSVCDLVSRAVDAAATICELTHAVLVGLACSCLSGITQMYAGGCDE